MIQNNKLYINIAIEHRFLCKARKWFEKVIFEVNEREFKRKKVITMKYEIRLLLANAVIGLHKIYLGM